jgi:CheY-like chemotaxis protein
MKIFLECSGYKVYTSNNGQEAIELMSNFTKPPDLILSDIMMPIMNGYDFLQSVSENPEWNLIPFIFLTAKTSPADIRFAKTLGIDDYVTKPFDEEDLLAIVEGRIARSLKYRKMSKEIEKKILESMDLEIDFVFQEKKEVILFYVLWDELIGPEIKNYYPPNSETQYNLQEIGIQLFQTTFSIYGHSKYYESQSVLLRISNIDKDGYLYFGSLPDEEVRGGERQYMLAVLAPRINYLMSLRVKEILEEISVKMQAEQVWDINSYWEKVADKLTIDSE